MKSLDLPSFMLMTMDKTLFASHAIRVKDISIDDVIQMIRIDLTKHTHHYRENIIKTAGISRTKH